jgi:hypothetical protein
VNDAELAAWRHQQQVSEQHRRHLQRRRQRQKAAHVASVEQILGSLQPPGGLDPSCYQPLLPPGGLQDAAGWQLARPMARALQPQQLAAQAAQMRAGGPLTLLVGAPPVPLVQGLYSQLVLDWGSLPAAVDPAAGGQLGAGSLRALRKRVQVGGAQDPAALRPPPRPAQHLQRCLRRPGVHAGRQPPAPAYRRWRALRWPCCSWWDPAARGTWDSARCA